MTGETDPAYGRTSHWLAALCGAGLVLSPCAVQAAPRHGPEHTYIVDLPSLSLEKALTRLARQTRISLDFSGLDLSQVRRTQILGLYTVEGALDAVLAGSGYDWQKAGPGAYRIIMAPPKPKKHDKPSHAVQLASASPGFLQDTIIVRATKRAAIAKRLPMSLSVMSGLRLEALQITDTNALAQHVAGMSSTNLGPSRNKIFIRGVSDGSFTGRQQATIGAYLDNVRLNYNEPDPFLQLDDVDHVEVLRGPQGTLYGAGSLGGLYRVITNAPDLRDFSATLKADVSLTKSGSANSRLSATLNMPLRRDRMALRVTGYLDHDGGYIDDVNLGLKNVNTTDVFGVRARLLMDVRENWQVNAGFNFQDVISDDTQYFLDKLGPFKRANFVREPHEDDFVNPHADIKGMFSWGDIVSSTSLVHRSIGDTIDASRGVPKLSGLPVTPSPYVIDRLINMVTNETRLVSRTGGRIDWLLGAFFSRRHETYTADLTIPGSAAALPGGAISGDVAFSERRRERTHEIALFGETTVHVLPKVDITGGLRWYRSNERSRSTIDGALGTSPVMRTGISRSSRFTPKAVLSYQASEHVLLYGQVSQGFRPGGINLNSPDSALLETEGTEEPGEVEETTGTDQTFDPDKLTMYEVGSKFSLLDQRLQVTLAAFTLDWTGIQSEQILPDGFTFILNAGNAQNKGLELSMHYTPTARLTVDANLSFNDDDLSLANPFFGNNPNGQLPSIPHLSGGASLQYRWPAGGGKDWLFDADYTYAGRSNLTFSSTDNRTAERSNLFNARLALEAPGRWQGALYVNNIMNDRENTFAFGNPFSFRQNLHTTPPVPRTIGIALKRHF